ncbi:hypothetical protein PTTG_25677 [Puccinia triticina 1-1 BBBD Race 1]|uniref:Secreted protein n=1 Tax=Puccinia triticina (isolate 1-1 / race 1 (BBBD)) TaxID=630390 RepID=A0A180H079_PUCT1|nr:hypothetical protein PTTG_25677 [Puccinia triticina 1-1 BBBD Race 1]
MKSAIAMPLSTILLLFTIPDRNGAKRPDPKIEKPFLNFMPGDYYWVCPWYLSQMLCLHPITSKRSVPHDFRENQGLEHNPLFFCRRGYMGLCCGMPIEKENQLGSCMPANLTQPLPWEHLPKGGT